jgi:hypothetical protein
VSLPLVVAGAIFLPAFAAFLGSERNRFDMGHPLNPFYVLEHGIDVALAVEFLVVLVFLLNIGRIGRAVAEVMRASRENRSRVPRAA